LSGEDEHVENSLSREIQEIERLEHQDFREIDCRNAAADRNENKYSVVL
jgi:hypothetical protein